MTRITAAIMAALFACSQSNCSERTQDPLSRDELQQPGNVNVSPRPR